MLKDVMVKNIVSRNLAVFFLYCLISIGYFGFPTLAHIQTRYVGMGFDPLYFIWCLYWLPHALIHHLSFFFTRYMWAPQGINLSWANQIPALSFIFSPLTLLFGPIAANNLIAIISPVLSSFFAYILIKYLTKSSLAGFIGGYLYGFSPYTFAFNADMNLYFICLIPLIAYLFFLKYDGKIKTVTYIITTSVLAAAEFLISPEIFATMIFFGCLSIIVSLFLFTDERIKLYKMLYYSALSLIISFILISPFIYNMLITINNIPGYIMPPDTYSVNLINIIIPAPIIFFGGAFFVKYGFRLFQTASYIGIPLIVIVILYAIKEWKNKSGQFLIIMLSIGLVFSFGPYLHIMAANTNIPMPWFLFYKLPFIGKALPLRLMLYSYLIIAVITGFFVANINKNKLLNYLLIIIAIFFIIPTQFYFDGNTHMPPFFQNGYYKRYIKKNSNVLILPFSNFGYSLAYQAYSRFYFRLAGGYPVSVPESYVKNRAVNILLNSPNLKDADKAIADSFSRFIISHNISDVIVVRGKSAYQPGNDNLHPYKSYKSILGALNVKPVKIYGVILYKISHNHSRPKQNMLK